MKTLASTGTWTWSQLLPRVWRTLLCGQNHLPGAWRTTRLCQEEEELACRGPTGQVWGSLGTKVNSDSSGVSPEPALERVTK